MSIVEGTLDDVKAYIANHTDPKRMSKPEFAEFLRELIEDLEVQLEATEAEL